MQKVMANNERNFYTVSGLMLALLLVWLPAASIAAFPARRREIISRFAQRGASLYYLWVKFCSAACRICIWLLGMARWVAFVNEKR